MDPFYPFVAIWSNLEPFGAIWSHLKLFPSFPIFPTFSTFPTLFTFPAVSSLSTFPTVLTFPTFQAFPTFTSFPTFPTFAVWSAQGLSKQISYLGVRHIISPPHSGHPPWPPTVPPYYYPFYSISKLTC